MTAGAKLPAESLVIELRDAAGAVLDRKTVARGEVVELEFVGPASTAELSVHAPADYAQSVPFTLRSIPGWMTVVPPVLAILLALAFRQVVPALLAGVFVGAWIGYGGMLTGFLSTIAWKVSGLSDSVVYELVPAFLLASLAVWGVSQITQPAKVTE